jgi:hypothetical protein
VTAATAVSGVVVSSTVDPPVGTPVTATVSCPTGKLLLGGGGHVSATGTGNSYNAQVHDSYPLSNNAWRVVAVVTAPLGAGSAMELRPYAICGS